jgi:hypothetical protein
MMLLRRVGGVLLFLVMLAAPAWAGVNAGGVLVAHDASLLTSGTNGSSSLCGQGSAPTTCVGDVDARIDGAVAADPALFKVYAVFPQGSSPRLMGITFGVSYDAAKIVITKAENCGDFELPDTGWPGSNLGNSVTWPAANTGLITPVYCFYGYAYPAQSGTMDLIANPSQGGVFGDDGVPAVRDLIAGYGSMGFDMDGHVPACGGEPGACCNRSTGICEVSSALSCGSNLFHGSGTTCTPGICGNGACCIPSAPCQDLSYEGCVAAGGAFDGLETTCALNADVVCAQGRWGACCNGTVCLVTDYGACGPSSGHIWLVNYACDPNPCEDGLGACCTGTDCTAKVEANCNAVWFSGVSCAVVPCSDGMGACCGTDGCTVTDVRHCNLETAFWLVNRDCSPDPCAGLGACCELSSASCFASTQANCSTIWTAGVTCNPNPCGACCHGGPSPQPCEVSRQADCGALPHVWVQGEPCSTDLCALPVQQKSWGQIKKLYKDSAR